MCYCVKKYSFYKEKEKILWERQKDWEKSFLFWHLLFV